MTILLTGGGGRGRGGCPLSPFFPCIHDCLFLCYSCWLGLPLMGYKWHPGFIFHFLNLNLLQLYFAHSFTKLNDSVLILTVCKQPKHPEQVVICGNISQLPLNSIHWRFVAVGQEWRRFLHSDVSRSFQREHNESRDVATWLLLCCDYCNECKVGAQLFKQALQMYSTSSSCMHRSV